MKGLYDLRFRDKAFLQRAIDNFLAMATTEDFPAVEGGGSLILAWQVRGKKVLVIGGGEVRTFE
jgi:precorrin-2 dehydrogenase/sirohydrochlorin ferrochelatase